MMFLLRFLTLLTPVEMNKTTGFKDMQIRFRYKSVLKLTLRSGLLGYVNQVLTPLGNIEDQLHVSAIT